MERFYDKDGVGLNLYQFPGNEGYKKLLKNLIDVIKEDHAKLGFRKEKIRLYYPLSSLNHFFGTSDDADQMQERLNHLPVVIHREAGRGCCDTQSGAILLPHSGGRQRVRP